MELLLQYWSFVGSGGSSYEVVSGSLHIDVDKGGAHGWALIRIGTETYFVVTTGRVTTLGPATRELTQQRIASLKEGSDEYLYPGREEEDRQEVEMLQKALSLLPAGE